MKPNSLSVKFLLQVIPPMAAAIAFTIPFFVEDEEDRQAREAWDAIEEQEEYVAPSNPRTIKSEAKVEAVGGEESARSPHMAVDTSVRRQSPVTLAWNYGSHAAKSFRQSYNHSSADRVVASPPSPHHTHLSSSPTSSFVAAAGPGSIPTHGSWTTPDLFPAGGWELAFSVPGASYADLADPVLELPDDEMDTLSKRPADPSSAVAASLQDPSSCSGNSGDLPGISQKSNTGHSFYTAGAYSYSQSWPVQEDAGYVLPSGIKLQDAIHSDRFYDCNKGKFYAVQYDQPFVQLKNLYNQTGSYDFLGIWASYIVNPGQAPSSTTTSELQKDNNTCWQQSCSVVLQHWLSYYGVFCKDSRELPYGYAYDKQYVEQLAATQCLVLGQRFLQAFGNNGGTADCGFSWFLNGYALGPTRPKEGGKTGGFFTNYFDVGMQSTMQYIQFRDETVDIRRTVKAWLDETLSVPGQIADFGVHYNWSSSGHAMTVWGYTVDEDGNLISIIASDSDDSQFGLRQFYIAAVGTELFADRALTKSLNCTLSDMTRIKTPQKLQDMLAAYQANDMVWNGAKSEWGTSETPFTTDFLPTEATGWDTYAVDGYYHTYFDATRSGVTFNDHASADGFTPVEVAVSGAHTVTRLTLDNKNAAYTFTGSTGASIQAAQLVVSNAGRSLFNGVALSATVSTSISKGTLAIGTGSTFTTPTVNVALRGALELAGGSADIATLTIEPTGSLIVSGTSTFTGNAVMKDGSYISFTLGDANRTSALLSWNGSLTLQGLVNFRFSGDLTDEATYKLISFTGGSGLSMDAISHAKLSTGTLSYQDNTLWLNYKAPATFEWDVTGTHGWSSTVWEGVAGTPDNANLIFTSTGGTVTVTGNVTPISMSVNSGNYTWTNGGSAHIDGDASLAVSGTASLTLNNVPLDGNNVSLTDSASLSVSGGASVIGSLEMAEDTTLSVGSGTNLKVQDPGLLNGTIKVEGTGEIHLNAASDTTISGTFSTVMVSGTARFTNRADKEIIYDGGAVVSKVIGGIYVGDAADAYGTTLRVIYPKANNFTIADGSTLELMGSGWLYNTSTISGDGTLRVAKNASYIVESTSNGSTKLGSGVKLDVQGTLVIGGDSLEFGNNRDQRVNTIPDYARVSGTLGVYTTSTNALGGRSLHVKNIELDGGTFAIYDVLLDNNNENVVEHLSVTDKGGMFRATTEKKATSYSSWGVSTIQNLEGTGNLTIATESKNRLECVKLENASAYSGDITIDNENTWSTSGSTKLALFAVELGNTELVGSVTVSLTGSSSSSMVTLGINGDASVGGLKTGQASQGSTYLYSGALIPSAANADDNFAKGTDYTSAAHTLTIANSEDCDFSGTVMGDGLSLVKKGSGMQSFSGAMKSYKGSITVEDGELDFGTSSLFQVQALSLTDKATLTAGTANVYGAFSTHDTNVYVDGGVSERLYSTVDATLNLYSAPSINLETIVDMAGNTLQLKSGTQLLGHFGLARKEDGYAYYDLFTNIGSLSIDNRTVTSGVCNDLFLQLADGQEVWYGNNTLSIRSVLALPEVETLLYGELSTREQSVYSAESAGVFLVPAGTTVMDMSGHPSMALGAAADQTTRLTGVTLANGADYRFGGPGKVQVDFALSGANGLVVDSQGFSTGRVELLQAATLTGDVVVQGGQNGGAITLAVTVANGLQNAASVTVNNGGTLEITGNQASNVTLAGGTLDMLNGSHMDKVAVAQNSTINVTAGSASLGDGTDDTSAKSKPGVTGTAVITKTGAGELVLASKYATGSYDVLQGSLNLSHYNYEGIGSIHMADGTKLLLTDQWTSIGPTVGTAPSTSLTLDGGSTMELHNHNNGARVNANITVDATDSKPVVIRSNGSSCSKDTDKLVVGGTMTGKGTVQIRSLTDNGVKSTQSWSINSTITESSGNTLRLDIANVTLNMGGTGANTFSGGVSLTNSTVGVNKASAFGTGTLTVGGSTTLNLNSDLTVAAISGGTDNTLNANNHTLTLTGATGTSTYSSAISGLSLVKQGAGTQAFTNVGSLTNVSVTGGVLSLAGTAVNLGGTVSVAQNAALTLGGGISFTNPIENSGTVNFASGATIAISMDDFTDDRYVITTGTGSVTGLSLANFTFTGDYQDVRLSDLSGGGSVYLYLDTTVSGPLTWDGTAGGNTWGDRNWTTENNRTASFYTDADVYFTGTAQNKDVRVVSPVTAGAMSVSAAGYTFSGEAVTTTGLTLGNGATATFNNALTVTGNVSLAANSNLKLTHDATLNIVNTSTGTLEVEADANVTAVTGANDIQFKLAGEGGVTITGANKNLATTNNAFAGTLTINLNDHIYIGPTSGTGQTFTAVNGKYADIVLAGGNKDKGFVLRECYNGETNAMNIGSLTGGDQTVIRGDAGGDNNSGNFRYIALHQDGTTTFAGIFRGGNNLRNPGLIMNGMGTIKLTGTSASTANLIANSGTIELSGNGYWAGDVIIRDGGQLDLKKADALDSTKTLTINGMGVKNAQGTVEREGALKLANGLTLAHAVTTAGTGGASVMTEGTATISGAVTGTGITKVGAGTLSLTGGATVDSLGVSAGTLNLSNTVTVANSGSVSGTLNVTGGTTTVNNLTVNAGGSTHVNNGGTLSVNGGTLKGVTVVDAGGTLKLDGTVSGTAEVQVKGNLNVTGGNVTANSLLGLWGGTHSIAGTVNAQKMVMVDKGAGNASLTIKNGGALNITGTTAQDALIIAGWSGGNQTGTLTVESGGSLTAQNALMQVSYWNGPTGTVNISGGSVDVLGISFVHSQSAGSDTGNRRGNLTLSDGGELTVGSGGIKGVEKEGNTNKVNVTLGDGTIHASADWTMGGYNASANLLDVTLNGTGTGTDFDTNGHSITIDNNLTGGGKLVKTGEGDLLLKGANTNTGSISVQGGSLKLAEEATIAHTNVTVASTGEGAEWQGVTLDGATLAASAEDTKGEIAGTLMQLKAGASLTVRDVVISDDTAFTVAQAATTSEPGIVYSSALEPQESLHFDGAELKLGEGNMATAGMLTDTAIYAVNCTAFTNLALDGTLTVDVESLFAVALENSATEVALHLVNAVPGAETLSVSSTGGIAGTVTTVADYGHDWAVAGVNYGTAGDIVVYWSVPEPATATLSLLALAALATRRRRRE